MPTVQELEAYIRNAAIQRGIDPDIAVRVAKSEGLKKGVWQSDFVKNGVREPSYGPFQLYKGGGLGNEFQKATGLDPADPATVTQGIDFALDNARKGGWGPWYGAKRVGITGMEGIGGMPAQTAQRPAPTPQQPMRAMASMQPGLSAPGLAGMPSQQPQIAQGPTSMFGPNPMQQWTPPTKDDWGKGLQGLLAGVGQGMSEAPRPQSPQNFTVPAQTPQVDESQPANPPPQQQVTPEMLAALIAKLQMNQGA